MTISRFTFPLRRGPSDSLSHVLQIVPLHSPRSELQELEVANGDAHIISRPSTIDGTLLRMKWALARAKERALRSRGHLQFLQYVLLPVRAAYANQYAAGVLQCIVHRLLVKLPSAFHFATGATCMRRCIFLCVSFRGTRSTNQNCFLTSCVTDLLCAPVLCPYIFVASAYFASCMRLCAHCTDQFSLLSSLLFICFKSSGVES